MGKVHLNKHQLEAVHHNDGPVMVVAGAGTGKTSVISSRIVRLIEEGVDPNSILALTFTEKAAGEMLDRVNDLRGGYTLDATIATFNGFGDELLRAYGFEIGLGNLSILGETGKLVFMREHLDELGLDYFAPVSRPDSQLELISDYISVLKQQLISPETYQNYVYKMRSDDEESKLEQKKHSELSNAYAAYIRLCLEHGQIDYDDQIYRTVELLKKRPNIRRQLRQKYRYILVDEYQDTNPMQSALIDLLVNEEQNIFVVGDDDQSIYGWRGATLANILEFTKRYPATKQITLIENYRSTQAILDSAYKLIQHNNPNRLEVINKLNKKLKSQTSAGMIPEVLQFGKLDTELDWIAGDIISRIEAGQDPSTIAVLARRNSTVQKIHDTLDLHGISHAVTGISNDLYDQPVIRQLVEILACVADPKNNQSLYYTLTGPAFELDPRLLSDMLSAAKRSHAKLSDVLAQAEDARLSAAIDSIEGWRSDSHNKSVGSLAYQIVSSSGWLEKLVNQANNDEAASVQVQALSQYFKLLKEFEKISNTASVHHYIDNLETLRSAGSELHDPSLDISDTKLNVLSVHRAKGLEWSTVYVADCTEGSFPMRKFGTVLGIPEELKVHSEADEHMAEERRLMYVAMTRAKSELILTFSDTHSGNSKRRPSRFLTEFTSNVPKSMLDIKNDATIAPYQSSHGTQSVSLPAKMKAGDRIVLSVSEAVKWLSCPLDFYYRYILQVPQAPDPTLLHGTIIHSCIEKLNKGIVSGNLPELTTLTADAEILLPSDGYISATQRERAHKQLLSSIELLYERFKTAEAPVYTELPFRIELPDCKLTITGRIDAVYKHNDGIEIRDYKTGSSVTSAEKAKTRATASQQLALYALAWRHMEGDLPALLSLDFVETGFVGSVKKQAKTIDNLALKLAEIPDKLLAGSYKPGKDHSFCIHPL